jgi:hypothetical protein
VSSSVPPGSHTCAGTDRRTAAHSSSALGGRLEPGAGSRRCCGAPGRREEEGESERGEETESTPDEGGARYEISVRSEPSGEEGGKQIVSVISATRTAGEGGGALEE